MNGPGDGEYWIWTVPNVVTLSRLLGLVPLLWTASQGHRQAFVWILGVLLLTDWIDGALAGTLDERTMIGARLDSAADWALYAAAGVALWWLEEEVVRRQATWFLVVLLSWGLSGLVAMIRFGRLPSYHTWGAKGSWLVVGVTAVHVFLTGNPFAVPWALGLVVLTNLEAVAVGLSLPEWRADVSGLRHALRIRREHDRAEHGDGRCLRAPGDGPGDQ